MVDIGKRVKKARQAAGLTQVELAKKINVSRSYIGNIEQNRHASSLATLQMIAEALHVDIAEFVGDGVAISETGLSNEEIHLVAMYRNMNVEDRLLIMQMSQRCNKKNAKSTNLLNTGMIKQANSVGLASGRA